jgi:hypothetical protein
MKIISHRGNLNGSKPERENSPSYIDTAISMGYDVEIDVRYIDREFYLGHDAPEYKVSFKWLDMRRAKLLIHCKNIDAAHVLSWGYCFDVLSWGYCFHIFSHQDDPYVLTNQGYLWVHDVCLSLKTETTIIPFFDVEKRDKVVDNLHVYACCTDEVLLVQKMLDMGTKVP